MWIKQLILILLSINLLVLAWQDFKGRFVNIYWLGISAVLLIIYSLTSNQWKIALTYTIINELILTIQIIVVWAYFSLKQMKIVALCRDYLGLGDILFMLILGIGFHPVYFVIFLLISCLIALLVYGSLFYLQKKTITIPLAGILAMGYAIVLTCQLSNLFNPFELSFLLQ